VVESAWFDCYKAAVLETDRVKVRSLIAAAESAIRERHRFLSEKHEGTTAEKEAMADALRNLEALRENVARSGTRRN
jgi:hypothetical protein